MKILTYLQARSLVNAKTDEAVMSRALTIAGRSQEWVGKMVKLLKEEPELTEVEAVERAGMGREILKKIPQNEWIYLVNPSLAPDESVVAAEGMVVAGRLFSEALLAWLLAQEIGNRCRLSQKAFTPEEARAMRLLWSKQEAVAEREEIAMILWGDQWAQSYSDWGIDALMSRVRKKLESNWQIVTVKGRGYMLAASSRPTQAPRIALQRNERVQEVPGSIYPSDEYIRYMNDPSRVRKVYKDLFKAVEAEAATSLKREVKNILCVNSYSYDNVDAIRAWVKERKWKGVKVYFVHYDPRAIDMHKERIKELGQQDWMESMYDDMRESKLKNESMDLVINDFRLNFNLNNQQNQESVKHSYRVLRQGGLALFSTVVDGRYENVKYGIDQEKAPLNIAKPGIFQADEHLVRRCWSVPYYRQLFEKAGFAKVIEFDREEGKRWGASATMTTNPWQGPYYRRWVVIKEK